MKQFLISFSFDYTVMQLFVKQVMARRECKEFIIVVIGVEDFWKAEDATEYNPFVYFGIV